MSITTLKDRLSELDPAAFTGAAKWAAEQLVLNQYAVVYIAPGDATEYRIAVMKHDLFWAYGEVRQARYYFVTLCQSFGAGYEWHGGEVHADYAAEKWTNAGGNKNTRYWTGAVVARFLTELSAELRAAQP